MALFIDGMKCRLCGQSMHKDQDLATFPAFVFNRQDPLHAFSDACFHHSCAEQAPDFEQALEVSERHIAFWQGRKTCAISGKMLSHDTAVVLEYLTQDRALHAFRYNFQMFDRNELAGSATLQNLMEALDELSASRQWNSDDLNALKRYVSKT